MFNECLFFGLQNCIFFHPNQSAISPNIHPTGRRDKREINIRRNRPPIAARPVNLAAESEFSSVKPGSFGNASNSHVQSVW